jgi:hypothetical protein
MSLHSFDQLFQDADGLAQPLQVAVAGGADRSVLEALRTACDRGWVRPLVTGEEREVRRVAAESAVGLHGFTIIDAADAAASAVALLRREQARMLMKGQVSTPALLKAMLDPVAGLRSKRVICQVVLMEIRSTGRRFLLADTGICIQPTLDQKSDILRSTVEVAHSLGEVLPRVAVVAATEAVVEAMPETLDAAKLQCRGQAGGVPRLRRSGAVVVRPGLCGRGRRDEERPGSSGRGSGCPAFPEPGHGQPDGEGDHVHCRLPFRRHPMWRRLSGRVHVPGRYDRHPTPFSGSGHKTGRRSANMS